MRHNKKFNHLGRKTAHRDALLANMAVSLFQYKKINTTLAKAKALRMYVEPIITTAKQDTTAARRNVFAALQNKEAVSVLFGEIIPRIGDRPGGYTRILKTGYRLGDAAQTAFIELVDYNENLLKEAAPKKKARTRRSSKKAAAKAEDAVVEEAPVAEAPAAEAPAADATAAPAAEAPAEEKAAE